MASLPDEVYQYVSGMMHPSPKEKWKPIVHRKLGDDIDLYQLTEGTYDMNAAFPFTPTDQEKIQDHLDDEGRLPLMRFGMCLVKLPNKTNVLLDAGLGPWITEVGRCSGHPVPEQPAHSLASLLEELDMTVDDIDFVVYSHCHGDHVGWTQSLPATTIHVMHKREYEFATYTGCPWRNDAAQRFEPLERAGKLRLVDGETSVLDDDVAPEISLILIDGHTPGHVCVEIRNQKDQQSSAIYIGDAMHFPVQVERPELVPLFDCCAWKVRPFLPFGGDETDSTWMPVMRQSSTTWNESTSVTARRKILKLIADNKAMVLSPHFPPPGIGHVKESENGKFEFCMAK